MLNWELKKKKDEPYFPKFLGQSEKGKQTSFFLGPIISKTVPISKKKPNPFKKKM